MRESLEQPGAASQYAADAERRSGVRLAMAIRAIPIGICSWGAKMLLEHLHAQAGAHGEPADHVATTQPELADALGCTSVTAGDLMDGLTRLELVELVRRLYRGEVDERAPNLRDGGTIVRLRRERIFQLAASNMGPAGTRYRPATEAAIAQAETRQRELENDVARLRGGQKELAAKLDDVIARIKLFPQEGRAAERRRRRRGGSGGGGGSQGGAPGGGAGSSEAGGHARSAKGQSPVQCVVHTWDCIHARGANDNAAASTTRRAA